MASVYIILNIRITSFIVEYQREGRKEELSDFNLMNVKEKVDKKYSKKSSDCEKSSFPWCHVQSEIDGNRKSLLLDHQPCQLSDLSCTDTYHIGKSVLDDDYQKEEILFDFEEEFHTRNAYLYEKQKEVCFK